MAARKRFRDESEDEFERLFDKVTEKELSARDRQISEMMQSGKAYDLTPQWLAARYAPKVTYTPVLFLGRTECPESAACSVLTLRLEDWARDYGNGLELARLWSEALENNSLVLKSMRRIVREFVDDYMVEQLRLARRHSSTSDDVRRPRVIYEEPELWECNLDARNWYKHLQTTDPELAEAFRMILAAVTQDKSLCSDWQEETRFANGASIHTLELSEGKISPICQRMLWLDFPEEKQALYSQRFIELGVAYSFQRFLIFPGFLKPIWSTLPPRAEFRLSKVPKLGFTTFLFAHFAALRNKQVRHKAFFDGALLRLPDRGHVSVVFTSTPDPVLHIKSELPIASLTDFLIVVEQFLASQKVEWTRCLHE